jgi:MarR family transcriptional regulator, organic hydroperoxide resistance regulator
MSDSIVSDKTSEQLAQLIQELRRIMMEHSISDMLHIMRREDLSMPQLVTLWRLLSGCSISISALSTHLNLSLAATSHLVERLVQGGFVSRVEDAADRRYKQVAITKKGRAVVEEVERSRNAELAQLLVGVSPALMETAVATLGDIITHLRASQAR